MNEQTFPLRVIGYVRSSLTQRSDAPKQGREGAPSAEIDIDPAFAAALEGLLPGREIIVLTWLHEGRRDTLQVHPRNHPDRVLKGVFCTRSPDRPNPIGLHPVRIVDIVDGIRLCVEPLEAVDGTPVIDIKPVISGQTLCVDGGAMS